jgi:hypothetical protein
MHLPEAENLIGHILEKWLKSKQTSWYSDFLILQKMLQKFEVRHKVIGK